MRWDGIVKCRRYSSYNEWKNKNARGTGAACTVRKSGRRATCDEALSKKIGDSLLRGQAASESLPFLPRIIQ